MRLRTLIAAVLIASPALLHAELPSDLKEGRQIVTSDGKLVGRIDRIVTDQTGAPQSAAVIFDSRFVYVPTNTLTSGDKGRLLTSLSIKDVRKLP